MHKEKLLFILFIAVLVLIPTANASATQVYVGVQISSAQAPGCVPGTAECGTAYTGYLTDNNWCIPVGSKMVVTTTAACADFDTNNSDPTNTCQWQSCGAGFCLTPVSPTVNPVTTTVPTCAGSTIWSGLLNLTNGTGYKVYLWTPSFCPGIVDGYCWVAESANKNCCDICSFYGLTASGGENNCTASTNCYTPIYYSSATCEVEAALAATKGYKCNSCTQDVGTYSYFNSSNQCYTTFDSGAYTSSCNAAASGQYRVCSCNFDSTQTGFRFAFTASF